MSTSSATEAAAGLEATMASRRTPEQIKASRALLWRELLTSLWAPLVILGLALIPYIILIEFVPPSADWAQPLLQGLGAADAHLLRRAARAALRTAQAEPRCATCGTRRAS